MRPSMAGSFVWKKIDDMSAPVDQMRRLFDVQMRIPRGDAKQYFSGNILDSYPGEDSGHYTKRMMASHLVYLNNCMLGGGFASLMPVDEMDPNHRFDSLELVNRLRVIRGLDPIEVPHDESKSWPTAEASNRIHRVKVNNVEYDICYCRRTKTRVLSDLLLEEEGKEVEQIKSLLLPNSDQIALSPEFFNASRQTWIHRAIGHQESRVVSKKKMCNLASTIDFPETCNGTLNNCQECEWCFENVAHLSVDDKDHPERLETFRQVNISHMRTPDECMSQMVLSCSVILSCTDCNFHFGFFARNKYFADVDARWTSHHQLETTATSVEPEDPEQRKADLFAKRLVREALIAASLPFTSNVSAKYKRRKGGAVVAETVIAEAQSLLTSLQQQLVDKKVYDDYAIHSGRIYHFNNEYWSQTSINEKAVDEMQSKSKLTLDVIMPTGSLAKELFDCKESVKSRSSPVFKNLLGSIMYPPCVGPAVSHSDFTFNVRNIVNAFQGKTQFMWSDFVTARNVMGAAVGNPSHQWPMVIALAISLQPYWQMAKAVERGEMPASVMNVCDEEANTYYTRRFDHFFGDYGCDESVFITTHVEPLVKKLYKILGVLKPELKEESVLEKLKSDNKGILPHPTLRLLSDQEMVKFPGKSEIRWDRTNMRVAECWMTRNFALQMADEIRMSGGAATSSWDRLVTPSAAIKAFYSHLESQVQLHYNNLSYRSLVSFDWPIPVQHMNDPTQYLMESMWEWYIFERRLLHLVQDTLMTPDVLPNQYLGDSIVAIPSTSFAASVSRLERYTRFTREVAKLMKTEKGEAKYLDASWRMDDGWMTQFWADWRQRLLGHVLGLKPSRSMMPAVVAPKQQFKDTLQK